MAEKMPQTFANHAKLVPLFHYVALPILLINLILAIYRMATGFSFETAWGAIVAFALILLGFFARVSPSVRRTASSVSRSACGCTASFRTI